MFEKIWSALLKHLSPTEKDGLENLISITFVVLLFLYVTVFLGDLYAFVKSEISKRFPEVEHLDYILRYGVILIVPTLYARAFLFAQDTLATGRGRYSKFFRASLPSRFLSTRLSCDQYRATELWFTLFNVWRNPTHPRHAQWLATFRRTYSCRFIYYLQRWLFQAAVLFALTLGIDSMYQWIWKRNFVIDDMWFVKALIVVATFYGSLHIFLMNRVGKQPTGCWGCLLEIENMHNAWLEEEIVKPSGGDFDRAWALAKAMSVTS